MEVPFVKFKRPCPLKDEIQNLGEEYDLFAVSRNININ